MVAVSAEATEPLRAEKSRQVRKRLAVSVALVALIGISRLVVFPASIWEQDEAYFSAAVVEISLGDSQPHPPFFPLWIGLGKLVHFAGVPPAVSLQWLSAVLGTLLSLPLTKLWSRLLTLRLAAAASVLGLMAPGVWLLSGRAFSGTAATAFLVLSLVLWTRAEPNRATCAAGSVAAGLAVLIRPQFGLVVIGVGVVVLSRCGAGKRLWVWLPAAILVTGGFAVFVAAAGGLSDVVKALSTHSALHFGALSDADLGFENSGLARILVHPAIALAWIGLAFLGGADALLNRETRNVAAPVIAALVVLLVLILGLSNPTLPRYAVPLVLLSSGFVVVGLRRLLGRTGALVAAGVAVCCSLAVVLPAAQVYRTVPSPPLGALERAAEHAASGQTVLIVDRRLHAFVRYREAVDPLARPVVFDHLLELGAAPPANAPMVVDGLDPGPLAGPDETEVFSCENELLRRLGQDRFLDVTVARARSAGPESMEDIVATIREGSGGRREGQPVGSDNDREDDEGEDGLEGGHF